MVCAVCGKPIRVDKPLLGSLHLCLTDCEIRGHHGRPRRAGFLGRRRQCEDCDAPLPS